MLLEHFLRFGWSTYITALVRVMGVIDIQFVGLYNLLSNSQGSEGPYPHADFHRMGSRID